MKQYKENEFIKTDLQFVCEMQRTIDMYECYFNDLFLLLTEKDNVREGKVKVKSLLRGTDEDDLFSTIWCEVENLIKHPYVEIKNYGVGSIEEFIKPKDDGRKTSKLDD